MSSLMLLLWSVLCLVPATQGLTAAVRNAFVNHFNQVRSAEAVSEHVSNMWKMTYDNTLEAQSQHWVDQCKFEHSHTAGVSEVIYVTSTTADTLEHYAVKAIDAWMSEKKFNADHSFKCCGTNCGHYCLSVKDVNTHVGCGIKHCSPVNVIGYPHGTLVVCQFKSQGGGAPTEYRHGEPCSACGADAHCENHLCVHGAPAVGR